METVGKFNEDLERYASEIQDWNRGHAANLRVPMVSIKSMISTSALDTLAWYMLKKPKEAVTDEDLKNYFDQMKKEHVGKVPPETLTLLSFIVDTMNSFKIPAKATMTSDNGKLLKAPLLESSNPRSRTRFLRRP